MAASRWNFLRQVAATLVGAILLGFVFGCASDEATHGSYRRMRPDQPRLVDTGTYFDGGLVAELSLEPISFHSAGNHDGDGDHSSGGRHRARRGGGFSGAGGSRGEHESYGDSALPGDAEDGAPTMRRPLGAAPTIELRAKFTNTTESPMLIAVTDVISGLGNFAVRPDRITLAPHSSAEIDVMPATYPDVIDELTVEVRVRHAGKNESRSLRLHSSAAADPTAKP
ncbi:MAG: hypothetical protein ABIZ04_04745 [Opitutus sp.]